jgi:hypothetical protein
MALGVACVSFGVCEPELGLAPAGALKMDVHPILEHQAVAVVPDVVDVDCVAHAIPVVHK